MALRLKRIIIIALTFFLIESNAFSQTISGIISDMDGHEIRLEVYDGLSSRVIASDTIGKDHRFIFRYKPEDFGFGHIVATRGKPLTLVLSGEDIVLNVSIHDGQLFFNLVKGAENLLFVQYAQEQPVREQALAAWYYLLRAYNDHPILSVQQNQRISILQEIHRLKQEDAAFISNLPQSSLLRSYLPLRKLVGSVSSMAQYRPEEIPATLSAFRSLDYTSDQLHRSGLLKQLIESHFLLLENMGKSLDSFNIEMQRSIDSMLLGLVRHDEKLNLVAQSLFEFFERQSLFSAAEYLSLRVLNDIGCTIQGDLTRQLEGYRAMKKGNVAPDISFDGYLFAPGYMGTVPPNKLSAIKSDYFLIVFAAGWCPKCVTEIPQIAETYQKWKSSGVEVVLVSLDENFDSFSKFTSTLPFVSFCDFGKWTSKVAKDYHIFGTPSMYLLNANREILLKPIGLGQVDAWVDMIQLKKQQ